MKIAVLIDDFSRQNDRHADFIQKIRSRSSCDYLLALTNGDFSPCGPARADKITRTKWALSHGVDLVIEKPVYTCLCDLDLYAFSAISLLTKLNVPCTLCLPCAAADPSILHQLTMKLLVTDRQFKDHIYAHMKKGCSFWEARANVMEEKIEGAKAILQNPDNNHAVEYLKSIKYCYSPIETLLINHAPDCFSAGTVDHKPSGTSAGTVRLEAAGSLEQYPSAQNVPEHNDFSGLLKDYLLHSTHRPETIWGCTHTIAVNIAQHMEDFKDFSSFARQMTTDRHSYDDICQILYRMILRITRPKFTLCSLSDYALYAHILGCRQEVEPVLLHLIKNSTVPILYNPVKNQDLLSHSGRRLWQIDIRASEIYRHVLSKQYGIELEDYAEHDMICI